jgi:CheY-like chemotaxis protein
LTTILYDGADPKLKIQAIQTLAEMNNAKVAIDLLGSCLLEDNSKDVQKAAAAALKHLIGHVPTRPEAVGLLNDAAKIYFNKQQPTENDKTSRQLAARFAYVAHALAPDNREIRLMYLTALIEAAAYANGLDRTLDKKNPAVLTVKQYGVNSTDEVLEYAMTHRHAAAATAAARLLGEIGKAEEVLHQDDKPSPLTLALQNPDRRLRMAALEAIVQLQPSKPYAGSSYVPAALGFFAASSGVRHALVAGPNVDQSRDLAGLLASAGLETDTATTGKELLHMATRSPDYELVWIDVSINHPPIGTLLQELRRDPRTASLCIGLMARSGYYEQAERLAATDPMTKAFARPHDEQAIRWQMEQLATLAPAEFVDFETRQRQAAKALDLLAELGRSSTQLYNLRLVQDAILTALNNPKLATKAIAVLANINSAESQRALVDTASRFTNSLELRKAAASAFRQNREKFGILLSLDEIRLQYDRYNASKTQDATTQHILGLILDCLEVTKKN